MVVPRLDFRARAAALLPCWARTGGPSLGLAAILVAILLFATGALVRNDEAERLAAAERNASNLARAFDAHVDRLMHGLDQVTHLAIDANARGSSVGELTATLEDIRRRDGIALQLSIIGPDGHLRATSAGVDKAGMNLSDRRHFSVHREPGGPPVYVSEPLLGRASNRWTIQFSRRIDLPDGGFGGVAVLSFDPTILDAFYRSLDLGPNGAAALVKVDGTVLARSTGGSTIGASVRTAGIFRLIAAGNDAGALREKSPVDGIERVGAFRRVASWNLVVFAGLAVDDVLLPHQRFAAMIWSGCGLLVFLVTLAALLEARGRRAALRAQAAGRALDQEHRRAEFLGSVLAAAGGLVVVVRRDGMVEMSNDEFHRAYGGRTSVSHLLGNADEAFPRRRNDRVQASDGQKRDISWIFTLLPGKDGGEGSVIGFGHDFTEQRAAEIALFQSAKLVTLGEMSTGVAHEINQPLNVIGLALNNLRRRIVAGEADTGRLLDSIGRAEANVTRARTIIEHMRSFGRASSDEREALDVHEAVEACRTLIAHNLRMLDVTLEVGMEPGQYVVDGDRTLVEQILLNLFTNAKDAIETLPGDAPRWIHVSARHDGAGHVEIQVADSGGGVPGYAAERIFQPFFTTKPAGKGTGLGLSLSYGIARDLGGTLSFRNEGPGAVFTLSLPAADNVAELPARVANQS